MRRSSPWPFPMVCPACKAATGKPHRAEPTEEHGCIRVILRCVLCRHEWRRGLSFAVASAPGGSRKGSTGMRS